MYNDTQSGGASSKKERATEWHKDPLTSCEVKSTAAPIEIDHYLKGAGIDIEAVWFSSEPRRTSHLSRKVIVRENAAFGEVERMEIYVDRRYPQVCFYVTYRKIFGPDGREIIENQFFTNDPTYAARHKWMAQVPVSKAPEPEIIDDITAMYNHHVRSQI